MNTDVQRGRLASHSVLLCAACFLIEGSYATLNGKYTQRANIQSIARLRRKTGTTDADPFVKTLAKAIDIGFIRLPNFMAAVEEFYAFREQLEKERLGIAVYTGWGHTLEGFIPPDTAVEARDGFPDIGSDICHVGGAKGRETCCAPWHKWYR